MSPDQMNQFLKLSHHSPGRLRCHSPLLKRPAPELASVISAIRRELLQQRAIREISIDNRTGSLLVLHNQHYLDTAALITLIRSVAAAHIKDARHLTNACLPSAVLPWLSAMQSMEKR